MIYQLDLILRDVRVAIDQNDDSRPLLAVGDPDTLMLDDIIRSKIEQAADRVHTLAPLHLLEPGHNFGQAIYWDDMASGHILLPHDFMRLIKFQMSDWERPVTEAITPAHPLYKLQHSRIKALRGTPQRPVCAISLRPEGRTLEFYSCRDTSAHTAQALYTPQTKIDPHGGVDLSPLCYTAIIDTTAALTLAATGQHQQAAALMEQTTNKMQP